MAQRPTYGALLCSLRTWLLYLDQPWIIAEPQVQLCSHGVVGSLASRRDQSSFYRAIRDLPRR
jgi:hypothetical protein